MPTYRIEAAPWCPCCYYLHGAGVYMRQVSELDDDGQVVWESRIECFKCGLVTKGEKRMADAPEKEK